jgi:hypothetical protein
LIPAAVNQEHGGTIAAHGYGSDISDLVAFDPRVTCPFARQPPIGEFPAFLFVSTDLFLDLRQEVTFGDVGAQTARRAPSGEWKAAPSPSSERCVSSNSGGTSKTKPNLSMPNGCHSCALPGEGEHVCRENQ